MRFKPIVFAFCLVLLMFPSAIQGAKWISISAMAFSNHDDVQKALVFKYEGMSTYLSLDVNDGAVWAPVNFPFNATGKVIRMDATVYDGDVYDAELSVSLVKVDLDTGLSTTVMSVGTASMGAPGFLTLTSKSMTSPEINNKKWAWYIRYKVSSIADKELLRLYGVRIRFK